MKPVTALAAAAALLSAACARAESARTDFGTLDDGRQVEAVELTTSSGYSARIITLGATLQSLTAPDADGVFEDVILGFDTPQGYLDNPSYMGSTVGRFANRIGGAGFEIDGVAYTVDANENGNTLHGGQAGWDKMVWTIVSTDEDSVTLSYTSPDGEMGFPGTLEATVTYTLAEDGSLTIDMQATTDAPTVVNMTNHAYFNLSGTDGMTSILGHELLIPASAITPVSAALIPTGELRPVAGTVFDFREGRVIGAGIRDAGNDQIAIALGYDHNFVLDEPADGAPRLVARLTDPASGRVMEVLSDQPGVQFYSGNFLDGTFAGKGGRLYRQGDALCLEPQVFPDAPNKPDFPSARLDPGETYRHVMVLRFSTIPAAE